MMKKCENCENLIYPDTETCPFCNKTQAVEPREQRTRKEPADFARSQADWVHATQLAPDPYEYEEEEVYTKRNWKAVFTIIITSVMVAALLVTGWFILQKVTSPSYTTKALEKAIQSNDTGKLADLVTFNGEEQSFNESQAEHLMEYYQDNRDEMVSLLSHIKNGNQTALESRYLTLEKQGSKWLFFPNYQFVLSPVSLNVQASLPNVELYVDDKKINTMKNKKIYELGGLMPGVHKITGSYKQDGEPHVTNVTVNTFEADDAKPVQISFDEVEPEITADYLKKNLETDLIETVTTHANQWVEAQKTMDAGAFKLVKNENYLASAKDSLSLLKANDMHFKGEFEKAVFNLDSLAFAEESKGDYIASVETALTFNSAYYEDGEDPSNVQLKTDENFWNYHFKYDMDKRQWMITGSESMEEMADTNVKKVKNQE
ncbi:hypothetical protein MUN89_07230 [Halobacillus salinarum]|uniref:Membrane protein YvbJ n=1 Tax=Halobacillus salinarum TaxID=2932257 RepID=A0ABY4EMN0_9BACI|nr:hypothetical protein [Halobacillus salinarum]UOQ45715.1 hypothetical protein MUN89_07230 [Halobacillus salinarum]